MASNSRSGERGFGYIGLLILLAVMGASAAAVGQTWSAAAQRDREARLLWTGRRIEAAIIDFHDTTPAGQLARFPRSLAELTSDPRYPTTRRHLRVTYGDPMTAGGEWTLVRAPDGGIAGVRSRSQDKPIRRTGFRLSEPGFDEARSYEDWYFGYPIEDLGSQARAPAAAASGIVLPSFDTPAGLSN